MRVSVAMAVRNGGRYLETQLESIGKQRRRPDEMIVIDDASDDDSPQILEAFAARAPFPMRLEHHATRRGTSAAFAAAMSLADGDVIALADQDDVWLPHKLEVLEAVLARAGVALAFSDAELIDDSGSSLGQRLWEVTGVDRRRRRALDTHRDTAELVRARFVTGATVAFRTDIRALALPIPTHVEGLIHDAWIAIIASCLGRVVGVSDALMQYRIHRGQQVGVDLGTQPAPKADPVSRLRRTESWDQAIDTAEALCLRVSDATALRSVTALVEHYRRRMELPSSLGARARVVVPELAKLRYHHWAAGSRSALKDLLGLHVAERDSNTAVAESHQ